MITGVSYMGHHSPKHLEADLKDIRSLGCDDVLIAIQENDLKYKTGKTDIAPKIALDLGLRPIAILWGGLNLFGGGKQSHLLLEYPEVHQVNKDGSYNPRGCYVNPVCVEFIQNVTDRFAHNNFMGYFIDEPTKLDCFCDSCCAKFEEWYGTSLHKADEKQMNEFRGRCVINYIEQITGYCKKEHPDMETQCCVMPCDRDVWHETAQIEHLDNIGTDIYWCNNDRDVEEMVPIIRELQEVCSQNSKKHHQWLQSWNVRAGREFRISEQGEIFIREQPDALYVWAYESQIGMSESSDSPEISWKETKKILRQAKEQS